MSPRIPGPRIPAARPARRAFTLVEVVLAIGIATGLLVVALVFYRQTTDLRAQVLQESERLAAVRLMMSRLAGDLRSARVGAAGGEEFRGSATAMSFVTATVSAPAQSQGPAAAADSVRVLVSTVTATRGTNRVVVGLLRQEQRPGASSGDTQADVPGTFLDEGLPPADLGRAVEPTTEWIRFARFRYWDGGAWVSGWTNSAPPPGVEVLLGLEPQPEDGTPDDYPYEAFRRVIFVPSGVPTGRGGAEGAVLEGGPSTP